MESEVQQLIQMVGPEYSCILMRNNSGALPDKTGRVVRYGLGNVSKAVNERMKSSDLIGITQVVVTPDMVGKSIGVFTAVEVKDADWKYSETPREKAQLNFIEWVRSRGGIAGFARSVDEFRELFRGV